MSDETVTRDLMRKLCSDVTGSMLRTLSLGNTKAQIPIAMSAGSACLGVLAGILNQASGAEQGDKPDPDCVLLAGLLVARAGIGGDDPIGAAYRDLALLKAAEVRLEP